MAVAYLGLGSNLGDREKNIQEALALLEQNSVRILKKSSLIETDPVGGPPQEKFLNGAAKIETKFSPEELLKTINRIEEQLGRIRKEKDGPRTIDIDILTYDQIQIQTPTLTIPHPRMQERDFVLIPLKEIS